MLDYGHNPLSQPLTPVVFSYKAQMRGFGLNVREREDDDDLGGATNR